MVSRQELCCRSWEGLLQLPCKLTQAGTGASSPQSHAPLATRTHAAAIRCPEDQTARTNDGSSNIVGQAYLLQHPHRSLLTMSSPCPSCMCLGRWQGGVYASAQVQSAQVENGSKLLALKHRAAPPAQAMQAWARLIKLSLELHSQGCPCRMLLDSRFCTHGLCGVCYGSAWRSGSVGWAVCS